MMTLRQRLSLVPEDRDVLNALATQYHYLHRPVHVKSSPFGWRVAFDGQTTQADGVPTGFIVFASVHFTKLAGEFGYPGLPTKWQVLSLARLWLHDALPHNSETCVIAKALSQVQRRWIDVHPPRFLDEPYHIVKVISFADTAFHAGTVYRAANFRETGRVISHARHKGTRGAGCDGHELIRFIYDLPTPRWTYQPEQLALNLC